MRRLLRGFSGSGARDGWVWGLVGCSLLIALRPVAAVELRDFRMADHPEFTRLVFEFDARADYEIERAPGGRSLVVSFAATGRAQFQRSWGPWVKRAVVEPLLDVTLVHVELREPDVRVFEERLENPPRIVLDVRRAPSEPPPNSSGETPAAAEPAPPAGSPVVAAPAPPAESPPPADSTPSPQAAGRRVSDALSRDLPPDVDPERVHDLQSIAAQLSDAERLPVSRPAPAADRSGSLAAYGALAALLLAVTLLGVFGRRGSGLGWLKRRGVEERRPVSRAASRAGPRAAEMPSSPGGEVPERLPGAGGEAPSAMPEDLMLDPPLESRMPISPDSPSPVSEQRPVDTAGADESRLEGLARRVEALEFALERALQGRERLEAQLAAQGEELRVQRAALARTQRAVRSLSRSGDPRRDDGVLRG